MVSAVQAVPNIVTASLSPVVGQFFQVVQGADLSLFTPSSIVSLGNTPTGLLIFNAAGFVSTSTGSANTLLNPVTGDAAGSDTATTAVVTPTLTPNPPVVPTTKTIPASSTTVDQTTLVPALIATALAAVAPTTSALPATIATAPAIDTTLNTAVSSTDSTALTTATVATTTVAAPLTPAVAETAGVIPPDTSTMPVNTVVNPAVQASANIETNPAYASMAAGLYVNVATYRAQHAMADTTHSPQPTTPVMAVAAVVANSQEGSSDFRRNRSRWMRG